MFNLEQCRVVENNDNFYLVEDEEGHFVKLYKIDKQKIDREHIESVKKVAEAFDKEDIDVLISGLEKVIKNEPKVSDYLWMATQLTQHLEECYRKVGRPNLFHYSIKNINPEIYGKAQTFMNEVQKLFDIMREVLDMMTKMGKM